MSGHSSVPLSPPSFMENGDLRTFLRNKRDTSDHPILAIQRYVLSLSIVHCLKLQICMGSTISCLQTKRERETDGDIINDYS